MELAELSLVVIVIGDDALHGFHASFCWRCAAPHHLDDGVRAVDLDALFAATGRACRADFVIDKQSTADDRRIADAPGYLPGQTAGRRHPGEVATLVDGNAVDRPGRR